MKGYKDIKKADTIISLFCQLENSDRYKLLAKLQDISAEDNFGKNIMETKL